MKPIKINPDELIVNWQTLTTLDYIDNNDTLYKNLTENMVSMSSVKLEAWLQNQIENVVSSPGNIDMISDLKSYYLGWINYAAIVQHYRCITRINRKVYTANHAYEINNGWSNYLTWIVSLWISNTESDYKLACNLAKMPDNLAVTLKDMFSVKFQAKKGLSKTFLKHAFDNVNWQEIAAHYIEIVKEN